MERCFLGTSEGPGKPPNPLCGRKERSGKFKVSRLSEGVGDRKNSKMAARTWIVLRRQVCGGRRLVS